MRTIATIEGNPIYEENDLSVTFTAAGRIDNDGSGGNPEHDPDFQPDTSLHNHGKALNAETELFIVAPPQVIKGVKGIVLGCAASVTFGNKTVNAVVGDIGPKTRLGEMSVACARALGIPSSPITGGVEHGVKYVLWPGKAAPGYTLQPSA